MSQQNESFEAKLADLKDTVNKLESGNVPLDHAMQEFQHGIKLSNQLHDKLANAKYTLAKVTNDKGQEVPYDRDKNGRDVNDDVTTD